MIEQIKKYLLDLQVDICEEFGNLDSKSLILIPIYGKGTMEEGVG